MAGSGCRISQLPLALSLVGMIGLLACSEPVGPASHLGPGIRADRLSSDTATAVTASSGATRITSEPSARLLAFYDTSFVITVGTASAVSVFSADRTRQLLRIIFPEDAPIFDAAGNRLRIGETVRVKLRVDSAHVSVQFGQGSYSNYAVAY